MEQNVYKKRKPRGKRILIIAAVIVGLVLIGLYVLGLTLGSDAQSRQVISQSVSDNARLNEELEVQKAAYETLKEENEALKAEIEELKAKLAAVPTAPPPVTAAPTELPETTPSSPRQN